MRVAIAVFLPLLSVAGIGAAHDLRLTVVEESATVMTLVYSDGTPFSFERYEIYAEGESIPAQVGRTDHKGRIAFLPERSGSWRLRTFSEDGHGVDRVVRTDETGSPAVTAKPLFDRTPRIITGVGIILGLFGLLALWLQRKRR